MNPWTIVVWALALIVMIAGPVVACVWFRQRHGTPWSAFLYGALIFGLFQLVTRTPAVLVLGRVLAPRLQADQTLRILWLVALGLSAGLFESVGRWVGYRWLFKGRLAYSWANGVAYGLGHGGIESVLLVGLSSLSNFVQSLYLNSQTPEQLNAQFPGTVGQQLLAAREQVLVLTPWDPFWAALERITTITVHVGLSLVVLLAIQKKQSRWLWLAVLIHGLLDVGVGLFAGVWRIPVWGTESYGVLWALVALWFILRQRRLEARPL